MDLESYHNSEQEKQRTADLLRLLPHNRKSVLDIGARDGYFSNLLTKRFARVVGLDLCIPAFDFPGVERAAADTTRLPFPFPTTPSIVFSVRKFSSISPLWKRRAGRSPASHATT